MDYGRFRFEHILASYLELARLRRQAEAHGLELRNLALVGTGSDGTLVLVRPCPKDGDCPPAWVRQPEAPGADLWRATRVDGARELVTPGQTGWLVPPKDPQALARQVGQVLQNWRAAQETGQRAAAAADSSRRPGPRSRAVV